MKFPLPSGGNSFFYTFCLVLLFCVSLFNVLDQQGKVSALTFGFFGAELIDATSDLPYRIARSKNFESEVVYDTIENGQGGIVDSESIDVSAYPTTSDDALTTELAPLVVDESQRRDQIVYYVVDEGDTLSEIAQKFNLAPSTIVWANSLSAADYIKAGQRLEVLPTDGVRYEVKKGDTIATLAQRFQAQEGEIIAYNHLPADGALRVGDALIIPEGKMPSPPPPRPTIAAGSQSLSNKYFIFPTTGRRSQGLHGYNGVDISNQCGTPIYATADGQVTDINLTASRSRSGPSVFSGYGNHLKIKHPNGVVTLYGHLKDIFVFEGQNVRQGSMIATMGGGFEYLNGKLVRMEGAGRSSGCHLHFEVRGARNPLLAR